MVTLCHDEFNTSAARLSSGVAGVCGVANIPIGTCTNFFALSVHPQDQLRDRVFLFRSISWRLLTCFTDRNFDRDSFVSSYVYIRSSYVSSQRGSRSS